MSTHDKRQLAYSQMDYADLFQSELVADTVHGPVVSLVNKHTASRVYGILPNPVKMIGTSLMLTKTLLLEPAQIPERGGARFALQQHPLVAPLATMLIDTSDYHWIAPEADPKQLDFYLSAVSPLDLSQTAAAANVTPLIARP